MTRQAEPTPEQASDDVVTVRGLSKRFDVRGEPVLAVDGLDLSLRAGEFVSLLGPSGCGKTTTLRMIAGLEKPSAGEIVIAGTVVFSAERRVFVPPERRGLGMVFQSYAIWPHMTVRDNVAFPLKRGIGKGHHSREEIAQRVDHILEVVDCLRFADRYPSELSGGQQQRVGLARMLVYEPNVLLFDEPLSNLDAKLRERMRLEIHALRAQLGFAALYVTHDREEALALSDTIVVMDDGVGLQTGTPAQVYEKPATAFVADFLGPANLLGVDALKEDAGVYICSTGIGEIHCGQSADPWPAADAYEPGTASVLIRPTSLRVAATPGPGVNKWPTTVLQTVYLGERRLYTLGIGAQNQVLTLETHTDLVDPDSQLWVEAPVEKCRLVHGSRRQNRRVTELALSARELAARTEHSGD
jgi:iron(III) transport system ATP-binding protein